MPGIQAHLVAPGMDVELRNSVFVCSDEAQPGKSILGRLSSVWGHGADGTVSFIYSPEWAGPNANYASVGKQILLGNVRRFGVKSESFLSLGCFRKDHLIDTWASTH
ncbi:unnamed protein product [Protopolystoma xenopodis]|uniref:Uncharacterized protein n=1 Tax=Protopolystoma xenopodis TaxID=117903 RepID=A0A448WPC6_9PLAT|nr:unnamed protein product [Protopolystoma xenopodis]